ncbi:TniQ family protein [Shewanella sp. 5S214]|uniref:TniQ family protein n=1 Tax=Shewanella sp. 5S214 TaxID=3229999 RepID=UPI00352F02DC
MNNRQLLIRLKSQHAESLQGYIYRLCRVNGYQVKMFSALVRQRSNVLITSLKPSDRKIVKGAIQDLTNGSLRSDTFDERLFKQDFGELFEYQKIKLCIECYRSKKIIHRLWSFKHYLVCSHHGLLLVDRCDQCHVQFSGATLIDESCCQCKKPIGSIAQKNYEVDPISYQISQLREFNEQTLDDIRSMVQPLTPYGMLYSREKYRGWLNSKETEISSLYEAQTDFLSVFKNRELTRKLIFDYIENAPGNIAVKFETSFYHNLRKDIYQDFKADLQYVLFDKAEQFTPFNVTLNWIDVILHIPSEKVKRRLNDLDPGIITGRGNFSVCHMSQLQDIVYVDASLLEPVNLKSKVK